MPEILFIDRYPLRLKPDRNGGVQYDPIIQLVVTHENVTQWHDRMQKNIYDWAFDTCFTGELVTSSEFLKSQYNLVAGKVGDRIPQGSIHSHLRPNGHTRFVSQGFGEAKRVPNYGANAWVLSNLPHFRDTPIRIPLNGGVAAQPQRERHLIGRDLFLGLGVKIQIDFDLKNPSLSMWVPHTILVP